MYTTMIEIKTRDVGWMQRLRRKEEEFWMKYFGMDFSVKGRKKRLVQKRHILMRLKAEMKGEAA